MEGYPITPKSVDDDTQSNNHPSLEASQYQKPSAGPQEDTQEDKIDLVTKLCMYVLPPLDDPITLHRFLPVLEIAHEEIDSLIEEADLSMLTPGRFWTLVTLRSTEIYM